MITRLLFLFTVLLTLLFVGCKEKLPADHGGSRSTSPHASGSSELDAGKLLTANEIQSVLGETLKEPVTSTRAESGFAVSQCYYSVTNAARSVVVTITNPGNGADARDPRQFWMEKFHDTEEERGERKEEERKPAPPEGVAGLGDEAFWLDSGSAGALYVLQGNCFLRVAIGGPDEKAARIEKTKKLAQFALKRL